MTPEQALEHLQVIARLTAGENIPKIDLKHAHIQADAILCELLTSLGYGKIAKAYNDIDPKWYA